MTDFIVADRVLVREHISRHNQFIHTRTATVVDGSIRTITGEGRFIKVTLDGVAGHTMVRVEKVDKIQKPEVEWPRYWSRISECIVINTLTFLCILPGSIIDEVFGENGDYVRKNLRELWELGETSEVTLDAMVENKIKSMRNTINRINSGGVDSGEDV